MKEALVKILIGAAFFLIIVGISFAFLDLKCLGIVNNNDGYVTAIFSLSGVLLFFSALMYQIKEYRLQITELKESVKAQTKSSETLDEQKLILIEQNINNLIFGMINNFNDFRAKRNIQKDIEKLIEFYQRVFALRWQNNLEELRFNHEKLNEKFATDIKSIFSETIEMHEEFSNIKQFVQFIYNIFHIIDENKTNLSKDYFTSFMHIQLNANESIILYLSNLVDFRMPPYNNLNWVVPQTEKITNLIKSYKEQKIDFKELDNRLLTEFFNELKQK